MNYNIYVILTVTFPRRIILISYLNPNPAPLKSPLSSTNTVKGLLKYSTMMGVVSLGLSQVVAPTYSEVGQEEEEGGGGGGRREETDEEEEEDGE